MKSKINFLCLIFAFVAHGVSSQNSFSLQDCIDYALSHNRDVNVSELQIQDAYCDLKAKRYSRLPSVYAQIGNSLTSGYEPVSDGNGSVDYLHASNYNNQASLQMSLPIWTEETDRNSREVYRINAEATKAESDYRKLQVKLDVLDKYYTLALTQIRHKIAVEKTILQDSTYVMTQKLFNLGRKAKKDVIDAQLNLEQDVHNRQMEQDNVSMAVFELKKAMNYEGDLSIDTAFHHVENKSIENIVESVFEKHPYIAMESLLLAASEKEIKSIKRERMPSVFFNASTGTSAVKNLRNENPDIAEQWKHNMYGQIGVDVKVPIFSRLETKVKLEKNDIKINQSKETISKAKESVKNEIETIILDIKHGVESVNRLNKLLLLANEEYQMALVDYKLGNIASYELNVYKNNYISTSLQLAQVKCQLEYKNAKINIYLE